MRASGMMRIALLSWYEDAAKEHEVEKEDIFRYLNDFCIYSARITVTGDETLPFELGTATDSETELRRKFDAYLAATTETVDTLDKLIEIADAPADPIKAPDVELTDPEVSGGDKSG